MALTQTQSRCHQRFSQPTPAKLRPLAECPTPLVSEAKVKDMLWEIAFVLHVTRRLSKELREPTTCSGAAQG
jgi:hypothetical protein